MIYSFEYKGKWKLPQNDQWFDGILKYEPESGAKLEMYGTFDNNFLVNNNQDIIFGKTDGGDITLIENWINRKKGSDGGIISEYQPIFIFRGKHFETKEQINFRKVEFNVFNLFQWMDLTGLQTEFDNNFENYKIFYKKLEDIKFELSEECEGGITLKSHLTTDGEYNRIEIEEYSKVTLNYKEKNHYLDILKDIGYFVGFVTLFTFEQSYPMQIVFKDQDFKEESLLGETLKNISCIYQHTFYNNKYKLRRRHNQLIRYNVIENEFQTVIKKWFEMYRQMKPVFNNLLFGFRENNHYSEDRFMDNVRALESFHRKKFDNNRIPLIEYNDKVNRIIENDKITDKEKKWLKDKLKYGNEPTLKNRIKELATIYENEYIIENEIKSKKFCQIVADTRNYYTHYDKSLEDKVKRGRELYKITRKIMGLLYSCILTELGIEKSNIEKNLKKILYVR